MIRAEVYIANCKLIEQRLSEFVEQKKNEEAKLMTSLGATTEELEAIMVDRDAYWDDWQETTKNELIRAWMNGDAPSGSLN